jgi:pimeloyl-ACP methyl ester carboxylesterase
MNEVIDPAVIDEHRPFVTDPGLDMYDPRNGFQEPPHWTRYEPAFVERYRRAQLERVHRLDTLARELLADANDASGMIDAPGFAGMPATARRRILERASFEPLMVIYRTQANLHYVDCSLDPSPRPYGSLLSPRPDLMNFQRLGFGRVVTPRGWLSTWSGLSSNANVLRTAPAIAEPTLVIQAGRDLDVYPDTHGRKIYESLGAVDRTYWDIPDALHYFEADDTGVSSLDAVMARTVGWLQERFEV